MTSVLAGYKIALTPPAIDTSQLPSSKARQARCVATREAGAGCVNGRHTWSLQVVGIGEPITEYRSGDTRCGMLANQVTILWMQYYSSGRFGGPAQTECLLENGDLFQQLRLILNGYGTLISPGAKRV